MEQNLSSIKYPVAIDENLGTLREEKDFAAHVKQLMLQVLFTNPGERINRPDFGCGIRQMVFAPNTEVGANLTKVLVMQALEKWLGNVIDVSEVRVNAIDEKLEVGIVYVLKARQQTQHLNVEVTS